MPTFIRRIRTAVPAVLAASIVLSASAVQPVAASSTTCIIANQTGPAMYWWTASSSAHPDAARELCAKGVGYQGNYAVDTSQGNLPPGQQACSFSLGSITVQEYFIVDTDAEQSNSITDLNRASYEGAKAACDGWKKAGVNPVINPVLDFGPRHDGPQVTWPSDRLPSCDSVDMTVQACWLGSWRAQEGEWNPQVNSLQTSWVAREPHIIDGIIKVCRYEHDETKGLDGNKVVTLSETVTPLGCTPANA